MIIIIYYLFFYYYYYYFISFITNINKIETTLKIKTLQNKILVCCNKQTLL